MSSIGNVVLFASGIVAFFLDWEFYLIYVTPLIFALINSVLYPFYYSLPAEYGFRLSMHDSSKFIFWYSVGEVVLVSVTGYLMVYTHPIALYVFMLLISVVNRKLLVSLTSEVKAHQEGLLENKQLIELADR